MAGTKVLPKAGIFFFSFTANKDKDFQGPHAVQLYQVMLVCLFSQGCPGN